MKYRMLLFIIFLLSFTTHSEIKSIETDVSKIYNEKCPSWVAQIIQLNTYDAGVISIKSRGDYNAETPENSLKAFESSYSRCRPAIELRVRLTKDKYPVVFNDTHIERMTNLKYNPESDGKTSSSEVSNLSLSQIKSLNLININGDITDSKIPTLEEFIIDYKKKDPGTLVFIYPENNSESIIKTIKIIDDAIEKYNDKMLARRFIIKIDMSSPLYLNLPSTLKKNGIKNSGVMNFNPVMTSSFFSKIENSTFNGDVYTSFWLKNNEIKIPVIDLEFKSENKNIASPSIMSMNGLVDIIKGYKKRVGVFVPVPDYIIWKKNMVSGFTVEHISGNKKPVDVMTAFYNEEGRCCIVLNDSLPQGKTDMRMNLEWQEKIGGSIFTSLDTDSIDTFFKSKGKLNSISRPKIHYPLYSMRSEISWRLGYFTKPKHSSVTISPFILPLNRNMYLNNEDCLYSKKNKPVTIFICNNNNAHSLGFNDKLAVRMATDDSMYIYDPATKLCLTASFLNINRNTPVIISAHWSNCVFESRWVRHGDNTFESYRYPGHFLTSSLLPLGVNYYWGMRPALNRWEYPD